MKSIEAHRRELDYMTSKIHRLRHEISDRQIQLECIERRFYRLRRLVIDAQAAGRDSFDEDYPGINHKAGVL